MRPTWGGGGGTHTDLGYPLQIGQKAKKLLLSTFFNSDLLATDKPFSLYAPFFIHVYHHKIVLLLKYEILISSLFLP